MAPRAAARLQQMGLFDDVRLYGAGKLDWLAAGLPAEGDEREPMVGELVRGEVPTCRPDERVADLAGRIGEWPWCAVVDEENVLLGRVRRSQLEEEGERLAFEIAEPGPSTYRPSAPAGELREVMEKGDYDQLYISDGEGRLLGIVTLEDLRRPAASERP
jgi:Mg/Co/Ni transporter MgtE